MQKRLLTTAVAALALALAASACGTTDEDEAAGDPAETSEATAAGGAAEGSGSEGCDDVETSTGPVQLTDSWGREVELDSPAERVAVLEWQQIEDVLTLCTIPVAVADIEGYSLWNTAEELPDGVEDLGSRGEPNLDALYAAAPDLVIVEAYSATDEIITTLEGRGVPVLATKGADAADPIQNMLGTFHLIGDALGREARADQVVAEFEAHLAAAKEAVGEVADRRFVYLDGWIQGGNVALRPFGQGSLVGELGEELGLENAWTGEVDEAYGLGQTDIEGMTVVGDATILYTGTEDPEYYVMGELEKNQIWSSLPAVAEGRLFGFPPGVWTFGGPRSSMQIIDAYVDLLTA
ncbi:MAG: ABC transporter substrate-binding protein [Actinomycetota bacterium]